MMVKLNSKTNFCFPFLLECFLAPGWVSPGFSAWFSDASATCSFPSRYTEACGCSPNVSLHMMLFPGLLQVHVCQARRWPLLLLPCFLLRFLLMQMKMDLVFYETTAHNWIIRCCRSPQKHEIFWLTLLLSHISSSSWTSGSFQPEYRIFTFTFHIYEHQKQFSMHY